MSTPHFSAYDPAGDIVTGGLPVAVVAAPFFGGPADDLAVADAASTNILIYRQFGGATRFLQGTSLASPRGYQPRRMASADFDGDGNADLAVAAVFDSTRFPVDDPRIGTSIVAVYYGDGAGHFTQPQVYSGLAASFSFSLIDRVLDIAVTDVNGDGQPDLLLGSFNEGNLGVLLHDDSKYSRAFTAIRRYTVGVNIDVGEGNVFGVFPTSLRGVAIGDYNADGRPDVSVLDDLGGAGIVFIFSSVDVSGQIRE